MSNKQQLQQTRYLGHGRINRFEAIDICDSNLNSLDDHYHLYAEKFRQYLKSKNANLKERLFISDEWTKSLSGNDKRIKEGIFIFIVSHL